MPVSQIARMSQSERMEWFQGLSGADRSRMMAMFRERGAAGGQGGGNSGSPRPAFVFDQSPEGMLSVRPVMIGLSDYDYTQVIAGLDEGDEVVSIPMSLVSQQDFINRIRDRMSLPGMGGGR